MKMFKLYYNPRIINANNIPKKGAVILFGNHLDKKDSMLVSCSCKRNIVFYHNNLDEVNKQLKNNGVVCIFPENNINEYRLIQLKIMLLEKEIIKINNYKYSRGTEIMTEVAHIKSKIENEIKNLKILKEKLKNKGININDYDVLLPFDDLFIDLANKYSASVVPFALTNDYRFLSKNLKIRFGESTVVKSNNGTLKSKLQDDVKKLIYKNY